MPLVATHSPEPVWRTSIPSRTAFPNSSAHLAPSAARRVRIIDTMSGPLRAVPGDPAARLVTLM